MKSNICKIDKGTKDLVAILKETEKVAVYNELSHKQALQLRLICEEVDGMLPQLIDDFEGQLWIEFENGLCKVNLAIEIAELTAAKKEELIGLAKEKKNAAAQGFVGKVRSAIEDFFLNEDHIQGFSASSSMFGLATNYPVAADRIFLWNLEQYKQQAKAETEAWDELEKSVLASVADDVTVGVKGNRAEIVIVKNFA